MREIESSKITDAVKELCIKANKILPCDIKRSLDLAVKSEASATGREILADLILNYNLAEQENLPICQDTGLTVVFAEIGQDVHIRGALFEDAVNEGVRQGYEQGYLRKSVVSDPLERKNTNDNTPAVIHTRIVGGGKIKLTVSPKGAGSENMSALKMFTPSASIDDISAFIVSIVKNAGSKACPPMIIGVGIGSNLEGCALLAKKAVCRSIDIRNPNPLYSILEAELLTTINALGIGPQGFGGSTTALAVNIEWGATHIAALPVAVNLGCHVTRHFYTDI